MLEKTVEKYSNDYSAETYYKMIDYINNQRDYFTDILESEVYDEFIEELKIHPKRLASFQRILASLGDN